MRVLWVLSYLLSRGWLCPSLYLAVVWAWKKVTEEGLWLSLMLWCKKKKNEIYTKREEGKCLKGSWPSQPKTWKHQDSSLYTASQNSVSSFNKGRNTHTHTHTHASSYNTCDVPKIFWKWQTRFLWRWNQVENCSGSWWDRPVVIKCFFISYTTCQDDDDDDAVKLAYLFTRVPVVYSCSSLDFFSNNFFKINGTKKRNIDERGKKEAVRVQHFFLSLCTKPLNRLCVAIRPSGGRAKASDPSFHSFPSSLSISQREQNLKYYIRSYNIKMCVCVWLTSFLLSFYFIYLKKKK